jgi:predicted transposase YdaD
MVTTITSYQFTHLSREEVEAMLNITLQETRFYQEAKEDGIAIGIEQGIEQGREEQARSIAKLLLTQKFGPLKKSLKTRIDALDLERLDAVIASVLTFQTLADFTAWLKRNS